MTMAQSVMKKFLEEEAKLRGDDSTWIDDLRHGGAQKEEADDKLGISFVDRAYRKTQPVLLLDNTELVRLYLRPSAYLSSYFSHRLAGRKC